MGGGARGASPLPPRTLSPGARASRDLDELREVVPESARARTRGLSAVRGARARARATTTAAAASARRSHASVGLSSHSATRTQK